VQKDKDLAFKSWQNFHSDINRNLVIWAIMQLYIFILQQFIYLSIGNSAKEIAYAISVI
jgi:hypothetical protein